MAKKVGNTYYFTGKGKSSGGGGGGGDAVLYTEQTLTTSQQMQARKNQGLYYSEGGGEDVTLAWDGDTTGKDYFEDGHLYKVSTDTPQAEQLKSFVLQDAHSSESMSINISGDDILSGDGYYGVIVTNPNLGDVIFVCLAPELTIGEYTFTQGIWLWKINSGYISQLVYGQTETIHHIEPKYIKDMYYEEEEIKTVTNPETNTWPYPSDAFIDYQYETYNRVSNDTPTKDDIISLIYKSDGTAQSPVRYDFVFNVAATNARPAYTVYRYTISAGNIVNFLVVSETQVVYGYTYNKGIYLPSELSGAYVYQVNYKATTIHQIPEKYIPSTQTIPAIPAVKMEVPSMGDDVYYNMGMLNVNQYVPSRDVKFSVEGRTVQYVFVADVINGGGNSQEGDTYTFTSGGLYWVQLELNYEYGLLPYVCAMVYVESDNQ